jgi:hypothetical protein
LYVHNIGGSSYRKSTDYNIPNKIASKREYLNSFVIEHPSICLRALHSGYSTCGVGLHNAEYFGHYFWANCKYISELSPGYFTYSPTYSLIHLLTDTYSESI